MTTKLGVYNGALRLCKERKLASLTENREPRRLLDDAWDGSVRKCLQMGQWTFGTRTQMLTYSPSVEPDFGYRRAFDQPEDMIRVTAICSDEYFRCPLLEYADERHYWYCDLDVIYVRFVSSHVDYGLDLSLWPESFVQYLQADLAEEIVGNLTGADPDKVEKKCKTAKRQALSLDAMNKPTAFPPPGSWNLARGDFHRWDRGNRHRLIG